MLARLRKRVREFIHEVRGHALWELIKWTFASSGFLGLIAGFFAWFRHAPLPIYIGIAAVVIALAFSVLIVAFLRNYRRRGKSTLVMRLDTKYEFPKSCRCRIEIENTRDTPLQNLKVRLISIRPTPRRLASINLPVNLRAEDGSGAVNPHAKGYFDFFKIDIEPARRRISLTDERGDTQSFEVALFDMLGDEKDGYLCEIRISALDLPESKVLCKLRLEARPEDALGAAPLGGYHLYITSAEEEALEREKYASLFRTSVRI
jgi:hypothetical protein